MIRKNVKLSKIISSDILQGVNLMIANKKVPTSFMDFVSGLLLIDNNQEFSKDNLRVIFKNYFPRLFQSTTFAKKSFVPFDHFFDLCQSNFYSKKGIISKVSNNRYKVNNILSSLSIQTPHKHLYNIRINHEQFEKYNHNITNLVKDCNWKLIEILVNGCKDVIFTYKQIQNIFGLTKNDVKKYLKATCSNVTYVTRTIGKNEQKDLELDTNLLGSKKHYKMIRGFTININKPLDVIHINVNKKNLISIKDRLEKQQFRYNVYDFMASVTNANRPKLGDSDCSFNDQYERLGFTCVTSAQSQCKLKEYVESVNIGSYKQMKNIFDYLKSNFHPEIVEYKASFKDVYNQLLKKFIYQF